MDKYFTDGKDIVIAECRNPESIAKKKLWMLHNTRELYSISKSGYERARQVPEYKNSMNRMISSLDSDLIHESK